MNFTVDEIAGIIGTKELQRIDAERETQKLAAAWSSIDAVKARVKELEQQQPPEQVVVPIKAQP